MTTLLHDLRIPLLVVLVAFASSACAPNTPPTPDRREILHDFRERYGTDWDQWTAEQRDELRRAMEAAK